MIRSNPLFFHLYAQAGVRTQESIDDQKHGCDLITMLVRSFLKGDTYQFFSDVISFQKVPGVNNLFNIKLLRVLITQLTEVVNDVDIKIE